MDMIKVRIQLKSEAKAGNLSPFNIAKDIYRNEGGVKAFYKGYGTIFNNSYIESTLPFSDRLFMLL
jgi:hypothetical protein